MNGSQLRRLVIKAARAYADQNGVPHYFSCNKKEPTVLFLADQDPRSHGNFLNASYDAICGNPEWERRLHKTHSQRNALPKERREEAMELDSCTSSDALLMNVFCYPGLFLHDPFVQLMGLPKMAELSHVFGFKARVPLHCSRSDGTEVDVKVEDLLIEAKLTERDFTKNPVAAVERYRDFGSVFEPASLCTEDGYYLNYQLIRNVLAAYHRGTRFRLICDARRDDLIGAACNVLSAVRAPDLRARCGIITWQEVAHCAPAPLQAFLSDKYGIASSHSV